MVRAITLSPSSGEFDDLTYSERVSRDRGLHVLLQDYSTEDIPTRRRFLRGAYREIVASYLAFGKIEHPRPLAVRLVDVLNDLSKKPEYWVGDYGTLGIYVLLQDADVCYILAGVEGTVRARLQGRFIDLDPSTRPEVTRLPVESGASQKELFDKNLHDFLALYRIQIPTSGSLDVIMGGKNEDFTAVSDALLRTSIFEGAGRYSTVTLDTISRKILIVRTGVVERVRSLPPGYLRRGATGRRTGSRKTAVTLAAVAAVVFAAAGAIWVSERLARGGGEQPAASVATDDTSARPAAPEPETRDEAAEITQTARSNETDGNTSPAGETQTVKLAVSWHKSFTEPVTSSPLLVANKVFFGGRDGNLYALDGADGRVLWRYSAPDGIGASPAVAGSAVITADYAGNVSALASNDGKLLWKRKLPQRVVSSPVAVGGEVLVGCFDGGGYALSAETGRILWKVKTGGRIRATPASAAGLYFVPSYDGKLYAVSQGTGVIKWAYQMGEAVSSSPAADDVRVVCGGGSAIYALDAHSGRLLWKFRTAAAVKSFVRLAEGRVYAGSNDNTLYCLDAASGGLIWKYATRGVVFSRPAVVAGRVFFASYDGNVYCLNALTGEEIDRFGSGGAVYSSPAVEGRYIYFGNNAGKFYCLDLYGREAS